MMTSASMSLSSLELMRVHMDFHILLRRQSPGHVYVRQDSWVARMVVPHKTEIVENVSLRVSFSRVLARAHDGIRNILDQLPHIFPSALIPLLG